MQLSFTKSKSCLITIFIFVSKALKSNSLNSRLLKSGIYDTVFYFKLCSFTWFILAISERAWRLSRFTPPEHKSSTACSLSFYEILRARVASSQPKPISIKSYTYYSLAVVLVELYDSILRFIIKSANELNINLNF